MSYKGVNHPHEKAASGADCCFPDCADGYGVGRYCDTCGGDEVRPSDKGVKNRG